MLLHNKVIVITGAATGIGRALALRFSRESPRALILADIDAARVAAVAAELHAQAIATDVSREPDIAHLVSTVTARYGAIDLFCSNAGIIVEGGEETPDAAWQAIFGVNVMAHIYAARAVLPGMLARGEGYLLQTVSAAGLLSQIGSAPYAVTKHAALAFAEWLSITYGDRGIKVSCICPQGVLTDMLLRPRPGGESFLKAGAVTPEHVADCAVAGLADERFLILPHPEVAEYFQRKASDYDRWLRGMRRLQAKTQSTK
jgi:NAD(P)-dependent dehydrogenase (short-subunit alcohol dehydrogenase family)